MKSSGEDSDDEYNYIDPPDKPKVRMPKSVSVKLTNNSL